MYFQSNVYKNAKNVNFVYYVKTRFIARFQLFDIKVRHWRRQLKTMASGKVKFLFIKSSSLRHMYL